MNLESLKDYFATEDIEWRIGRSGEKDGKIWATCLAYITNRAIMERLDAVVGPDNWKNEFKPGPDGGVMCGISIYLVDYPERKEWVTKWDGADNTKIEAVKGGYSAAMKRAAVQWGIGRYLYELEESRATITQDGRFNAKTSEGKWFKWNPPALPAWAVPKESAKTVANLEAGLKKRGDYDKALEAVNKAADIDTLDTLRAQIDEREWENGRRDKLVQTIDAKMAKLSEKLFAEEGK